MDLTPKYILMCEKAEEIQKQEFNNRPNFYFAYYLHGQWQIEHDFLGGEKPPIWLPRQDQLQTMVEERKNTYFLVEDFSDFMIDNLLEDHGDVPYTPPFKQEWVRASLEQLWLAFVMHEKYQKIWDEEKKDWMKEIEK